MSILISNGSGGWITSTPSSTDPDTKPINPGTPPSTPPKKIAKAASTPYATSLPADPAAFTEVAYATSAFTEVV